jgi:hypothetical protein
MEPGVGIEPTPVSTKTVSEVNLKVEIKYKETLIWVFSHKDIAPPRKMRQKLALAVLFIRPG